MKKMMIELTSEQQKQIKDKDMTEVHLGFAPQGELSESDLGQVHGGMLKPEKDDGTL